MNKPPRLLLTAVEALKSDHSFREGEMDNFIQRADEESRKRRMKGYSFPGWQNDQLFKASYLHLQTAAGASNCLACDASQVEVRQDRESDSPAVHYGLIASGNQVIRSSQYRDKLRAKYNILCFEMEAAGLMDNFPCLVIRGICDYSDNHKSKAWQPYAATTAAAYTRDLLRVVQPQEVARQDPVSGIVDEREFRPQV